MNRILTPALNAFLHPRADLRVPPLRAAYALLRRSVRIRLEGRLEALEAARQGSPRIFACRHGQLLPLLFAVEPYGLSIVISKSRDGELLAALLGPYGFGFVRGSSSLGGRVAALQAMRVLAGGASLGIAVDGPHGPRGMVQEGILRLARRAEVPIVPLVAKGSARIVLRRSWDHFELPLPATSVKVEVKSPVLVGMGSRGSERGRPQLGGTSRGELEGDGRAEPTTPGAFLLWTFWIVEAGRSACSAPWTRATIPGRFFSSRLRGHTVVPPRASAGCGRAEASPSMFSVSA